MCNPGYLMEDQSNPFLFLCHLQDEFYANFHFCMYTLYFSYSYYNDVILTRIHENTGSVKCAGDFFFFGCGIICSV